MNIYNAAAVDCGSLNNPPNGIVEVSETVFPGVATYSCNTGYTVVGGVTRSCQFNAMWSGTEPTCAGVTANNTTMCMVCTILQNEHTLIRLLVRL